MTLTIDARPFAYAMPPGRTALVIIDMQRDFIQPGGFGAALGNDVRLLQAALPPTPALLAALPERATAKRLPSIRGVVPGQFDRPQGCLFNPRCRFATDLCRRDVPPVKQGALCHYPLSRGVPQDHPETVGEEA